ncbi:hypothetical protein [Arcanobacterium phocae]|uniref:hypothetical protein n=1 Tax=Arcanobacterium phocae TaxID=131112 RepID=UPI001C0E9F14|nr:hypothetical protein [Arcanobacterium phocae]
MTDWDADKEKFVPLSVREGKKEPFQMTIGIPVHFRQAVTDWLTKVGQALYCNTDNFESEQAKIAAAIRTPGFDFNAVIENIKKIPDEIIFDVIDYCLGNLSDITNSYRSGRTLTELLADYLFMADHEYKLDSDGRRLVKRVDPTVCAAYERAISPEDEASDLLASAWAKQFSRNQDPSGAWNDARKAIEVLLKPIVSQADNNATITKMAKAIRDGESKFEADLPGKPGKDFSESPVLQFARALDMVGYPPNHHGAAEVSSQQSVTAVLQAVTVIGWLREGVFRRVQ